MTTKKSTRTSRAASKKAKVASSKTVRPKAKYEWPLLASTTLEGYHFRMSPKLIEAYGVPVDPAGEMMQVVKR